MRHNNSLRKLKRESSHRDALLRNMATSLVTHGRIHTTVAKAKEVRSFVEKIITKGKAGTLHSRRLIAAKLYGATAVKTVCDDIAVRFKERAGGYTRIIRTGRRLGDAAEMCHLEFVDFVLPVKTKEVKNSENTEKAE